MSTGRLRVYLGAAPGVGKTYKMLEEGHRRLERGTDVVVGYVEPHDRPSGNFPQFSTARYGLGSPLVGPPVCAHARLPSASAATSPKPDKMAARCAVDMTVLPNCTPVACFTES